MLGSLCIIKKTTMVPGYFFFLLCSSFKKKKIPTEDFTSTLGKHNFALNRKINSLASFEDGNGMTGK